MFSCIWESPHWTSQDEVARRASMEAAASIRAASPASQEAIFRAACLRVRADVHDAG
ncbi:MAG: hypothetical protein ACPIOQ_62650 [Promethearchaeia archaeon]